MAATGGNGRYEKDKPMSTPNIKVPDGYRLELVEFKKISIGTDAEGKEQFLPTDAVRVTFVPEACGDDWDVAPKVAASGSLDG